MKRLIDKSSELLLKEVESIGVLPHGIGFITQPRYLCKLLVPPVPRATGILELPPSMFSRVGSSLLGEYNV